MPSAGILTPVMVTDGGLGTGSSFSSFQPKMEPMAVLCKHLKRGCGE